VAQRLSHHLQAIERPDRGQDVRRVGALPTPRLEQLPRARPCQHRLEEQPLRRTCGEAAPERAQDRGVAARVGELQPQHVLPVEPRAHRVGGLAVRQSLRALQDRRQRQPPRGARGLAAPSEERREGVVGEHLAERIGGGQVRVALGEGGARDAGGLGGDRRERLEAQHHDPPGGATTMTPSASYQATRTNAQDRCHNIRQHSQKRANLIWLVHQQPGETPGGAGGAWSVPARCVAPTPRARPLVRARIAALAQLPPQLQAVVTALPRTPLEVGRVRVEHARPPRVGRLPRDDPGMAVPSDGRAPA